VTRVEVPITPSVLRWAIKESGYTLAEVSSWIEGGEDALASWLNETAKPSLTEMRVVASRLHRQLATFLLPEPPASGGVPIQFRNPLGDPGRSLNTVERRYVRRARRLQEAHAWLLRELDYDGPNIPAETLSASPTDVAQTVRAHLGVTHEQQTWKVASPAFDDWRDSVERLGIVVLLFPMGEDSCRGFSLWDDTAPLVAVNTAWKDEARLLTLFHELGHLVTRTNSACEMPDAGLNYAEEPVELWCDRLASALVRSDVVRTTASDLPEAAKARRGRNLAKVRRDELGRRGTAVFVEAVRRGVITESEALEYLDCPMSALFSLSM